VAEDRLARSLLPRNAFIFAVAITREPICAHSSDETEHSRARWKECLLLGHLTVCAGEIRSPLRVELSHWMLGQRMAGSPSRRSGQHLMTTRDRGEFSSSSSPARQLNQRVMEEFFSRQFALESA